MAIVRRVLIRVLESIVLVSLPPLILLSGLYLFLSPAYVRYEYGRASLPRSSVLTDGQRYVAAVECIRYLRTGVGLEALQRLEGSDGALFNDRELRHMADVKRVTRAAFTVLHTSALVVVGAVVVLARYGPRGQWARRLAQGAGLTAGLVTLLLIAVVANFNWFFTTFHHIFFEGDTWLFPYTDSLIQLYPLPFWIDVVQLWVLEAIIASCLVGGAALWWRRRSLGHW